MSWYTTEKLTFIHNLRRKGLTWKQVTEDYNEQFKEDVTLNALRKAYKYHLDGTDQAVDAKVLQSLRSARKQNHQKAREANLALDALNARDLFLDEIKDLVKDLPKKKPIKIPELGVPKGKRTTIELLLSDIHYGKKTDKVDLAEIRRRVREYCSVSMFKIRKESETYQVSEVVIACLGDVIESSTMHGPESLVGCEFGNAKQISSAIESIYCDLLEPLTELQEELGFKLTFVGVPGNHDRFGKNKTFHNPGEERLTYTIYKTLEFFCDHLGKAIDFVIPKESYAIYEIYGKSFLYEHGDKIPLTRIGIERHLGSRSTQLGKQITGMRMGHYHELVMWGRGRCIVNESVVGPDSYSDELGYDSHPGQTIVQYVETENRNNPFYQMVPVQLGGKSET